MYKKITHNIIEEHFDHPATLPVKMARYNRAGKNNEDVITVNVPLMIRLLEYAREDARTDVELHNIVEELIELMAEHDVLSMENYSEIIKKED